MVANWLTAAYKLLRMSPKVVELPSLSSFVPTPNQQQYMGISSPPLRQFLDFCCLSLATFTFASYRYLSLLSYCVQLISGHSDAFFELCLALGNNQANLWQHLLPTVQEVHIKLLLRNSLELKGLVWDFFFSSHQCESGFILFVIF